MYMTLAGVSFFTFLDASRITPWPIFCSFYTLQLWTNEELLFLTILKILNSQQYSLYSTYDLCNNKMANNSKTDVVKIIKFKISLLQAWQAAHTHAPQSWFMQEHNQRQTQSIRPEQWRKRLLLASSKKLLEIFWLWKFVIVQLNLHIRSMSHSRSPYK